MSVLPVGVLVIFVGSTLGYAMMGFSVRSIRTGTWSRDHLLMRLLAESACEELALRCQRMTNQTGNEVYTGIRRIPDGTTFTGIPIQGVVPSTSLAEARATGDRLGATVALEPAVQIYQIFPVSSDPLERVGLLRFEVTATLTRQNVTVTERVRRDHSFRVARTAPGRVMSGKGLIVLNPDPELMPAVGRNSFGFAPATDGRTTFLNMVTRSPEDGGLGPVSPDEMPELARTLVDMQPNSLMGRAHYVTRNNEELHAFLQSRLDKGLPLDGIVHNLSDEPLGITFPAFRGNCVISTNGPIEVGMIQMQDASKDRLTLVSSQRILVGAGTVEAGLICANPESFGVILAQRAVVKGFIHSTWFPVGNGMDGAELAGSQVEYNPVFDTGSASPDSPDDRLLSGYVTVLSPHPASVEHARDEGAWSQW